MKDKNERKTNEVTNETRYDYQYGGGEKQYNSGVEQSNRQEGYALQRKKRFYQKNWFVIILLILLWPVGLALMWINRSFSTVARIIITVIIAAILICGLVMPGDANTGTINGTETVTEETTEAVTESTSEEKASADKDGKVEKTKKDDSKSENKSAKKEKKNLKKSLKKKYGMNGGSAIRNDETGGWTIESINSAEANDPSQWAYDYYRAFWEEPNTVKWIVNVANNTTTSINVPSDGGLITVTQHDYVNKEEHDAKILGSGTVLGEWLMYMDENEKLVVEKTI